MNHRFITGDPVDVKIYNHDLSSFKWEEATFISYFQGVKVNVKMNNGIIKIFDMNDIKIADNMKCIHCKKKYRLNKIKSSIIIPCENREVTDYFCPGCSKVLNGYTEVKEVV